MRFCLRRGERQKLTGHHHPSSRSPLGFFDSAAPFLAGAKLPSRNNSLPCTCWRSFNSLRNARQTFSQTPCASQSRNRRQRSKDADISPASPVILRARQNPENPSSRWFSIHGRSPLRFLRDFGSKGAIFCHCASVIPENSAALLSSISLGYATASGLSTCHCPGGGANCAGYTATLVFHIDKHYAGEQNFRRSAVPFTNTS